MSDSGAVSRKRKDPWITGFNFASLSRQVVSSVEMRQDLPFELGQARGLGKAEHVSLLSIIKNKTAKV